jgi:transposase
MNMSDLLPGCRVNAVQRNDSTSMHIAARGRQRRGRCPECGKASTQVHSRYLRHPADLPWLGAQVRVSLEVRRFYCVNAACTRRTFAEQVPELLERWARRTRRLAKAQTSAGVALGGQAGARLLLHLGMPASGATLLRLLRRLPLPMPQPPQVVGVDDWALRRGQVYGTIVVDLQRRCVVDLLPDRQAQTLATWLHAQPSVEVVARDRSSEYARGITMGAPRAVQVADRWHLLYNVRQMLQRWLQGVQAQLGRLPVMPGAVAPSTAQRTRAYRRTTADRAASAQSRTRWQAAYEEVRRRHGGGESLLAIGRSMGLARSTVRKFAYARDFPERAARRPGPTILRPHLEYLAARLLQGCENALALWRELRSRGFAGTARQVQRWLREHRTGPARTTPHKWRAPPRPAAAVAFHGEPEALPSPLQLAWLLVQPHAALTAQQAAVVARVEQHHEVATVAALARRFTAIVRSRCGARPHTGKTATAALQCWFDNAHSCGVSAVETFAVALEQDAAAVGAALATPWSSGQCEGQINKLKLLKRQTYGRASFELLRRRVLLAA